VNPPLPLEGGCRALPIAKREGYGKISL